MPLCTRTGRRQKAKSVVLTGNDGEPEVPKVTDRP